MKTMRFTKAVATGNDFIIFDNRLSKAVQKLGAVAKTICDRKRSIGADGLIVLAPSRKADFKMRIFNPDGSEAEMCGNGSRCVALYAVAEGIAKKEMEIETLAGIIKASVKGNVVRVKLPDPMDIKWNFCLMIHKCPYKVSFLNTGVPHVVHFVDDLDNVDVKALGSHMRYHKEFSPQGTNADFVKVVARQHIKIRTYERGVEDETLACGTGAVASAIITAEAEKAASPITVETRSGEHLKVYFELIEGSFRNVYLEGAAELVFNGRIVI